ncbi:hypothetical protein Trydic_g17162 [Trypoxylus dichotomus]
MTTTGKRLSSMVFQEESGEFYHCPNCNKAYKHKRSQQRHVQYECGKPPSFACTVPGCTYRGKQKVHSHVQTVQKFINITKPDDAIYFMNAEKNHRLYALLKIAVIVGSEKPT